MQIRSQHNLLPLIDSWEHAPFFIHVNLVVIYPLPRHGDAREEGSPKKDYIKSTFQERHQSFYRGVFRRRKMTRLFYQFLYRVFGHSAIEKG